MIRVRSLAHILGVLLLLLAATMLVPIAIAFVRGEDPQPMLLSFGITVFAGSTLAFRFRRVIADLSQREGLLLVFATWLSVILFGSLPFYFSPYFATFSDAFFEATSGFTTTGATILDDVEVLPHGLQFWRLFSHWVGGMGIVLLGIAILPLLGIGGMALYRAEFSGAKSERLRPRIAETAMSLWRIYVAFTLILYVLLRLAGMDILDAVCHAFSTVATGGFSSRTASVGAFNSPLIEYIIVLFMILGGINFTRHYRLFVERRPASFFFDIEIRAFLAILLTATLLTFGSLLVTSPLPVEEAMRSAFFQTTSLMTTTGFFTANFELWAPLPQMILFALMFVGGCTGSTSGGLKTARFVLLFKVVGREFKRMVERRGVFSVRLGDRVIPENTIQSLLNLVYLAFFINFAGSLILAALEVDILTSISAITACMFNIGPGLGNVGPAEHYGHLPALAKWVLSGAMIAGRLEFYTALIILAPAFWRK